MKSPMDLISNKNLSISLSSENMLVEFYLLHSYDFIKIQDKRCKNGQTQLDFLMADNEYNKFSDNVICFSGGSKAPSKYKWEKFVFTGEHDKSSESAKVSGSE